jgi:hypothetical protein
MHLQEVQMTYAPERTTPLGRLLSYGLVGRDAELAQLHAWREQDGPMVLHGLPGIGKSTLLARFVQELPSAVYVDLARPLGRHGELGFVLAETLRQQAPGDGEVVVILDSLEEAPRLMPKLPRLQGELSSRWGRVRLLVSGRAPPSSLVVPQSHRLELGELEPGPARELFDTILAHKRPARPLPFGSSSQAIDLVGTSPLALGLAADTLARAVPAPRAVLLGLVRDRFVREFLIERILSRVPSIEGELPGLLRSLVRGMLALRRLSPRTIDEVLLPALHLPSTPRGEELYASLLERVGWLGVEEDGALVLDEDLRRSGLLALRCDCPALVEAIQPRATRHFEQRAEPWARAELAYHRLMAGEPADALGTLLTPEVCASLLRSAADLPPVTALALEQLSEGLPLDTVQARRHERQIESSADVALRAGDTGRARAALSAVPTPLPTSPLFHLRSRLHEAQGDWADAVESEQRNLAAARASADPRRLVASALRLASLLLQSAEAGAAQVLLQEVEADGLLHGHLELRSELRASTPPPAFQRVLGGR